MNIRRVKRDVIKKKKQTNGRKEKRERRKPEKEMIYIYDNIERIDRYYRAPTRFFLFDKFSFEKLTRFESKKGKKERERNMSR